MMSRSIYNVDFIIFVGDSCDFWSKNYKKLIIKTSKPAAYKKVIGKEKMIIISENGTIIMLATMEMSEYWWK